MNFMTLIPTIKGCLALSGMAGLSLVIGSATDNVLDENTPVSLGAVLACAGVIVTGSWWLSRKMALQERMHAENKRRFKVLERNVHAIQNKLGVPNVEMDEDE